MPVTRPSYARVYRAFAAVLLAGLPASAGTFSYTEFNADANSGISTDYTYTAKGDFNRPLGDRIVNGVPFTDGNLTGTNFELVIAGGANALGRASSVSGNAGGLVSDFYYGGTNGQATLTLSGLTPGQTYVTSWYNQGYGAALREVDITPSDTGSAYRFNEDFTSNTRGNILRYTFTAQSGSISFAFDAVNDNDSFHHYAFTNALARPDIVTPRVFQAAGAAPLQAFATEVRTGDLLESSLAPGGVTSSGNFNIENAGGIPTLTNGIFLIKGGNVTTPGNELANSELATVQNNTFLQYMLDTSTNTLGYDVSLIQLFGGWNDNGRDRALYQVLYSTVSSDSFTPLGSLNFDSQAPGGTPSAIQGIFDTNLTGIDGIRIEFLNGQDNGYAGLGEIDVVGAPTIPEPTTAVLACLAGGALIVRRRRQIW